MCKNIMLDNLVCQSPSIMDEGSPALGGGQGTGGDEESDGLVKGESLWDEEW